MQRLFRTGLTVAGARALRRRTPLVVAWNVTSRCNQRCVYCAVEHAATDEMDTATAVEMLRALHAMGTRWLTFSGGEPLLRDDLPLLVAEAHRLGIYTSLSTNGSLLPTGLQQLRGLDRVTLSYDGPESTHDRVRGPDTHSAALAAMLACHDAGLPINLQCVLSAQNLSDIDHVSATAHRHGATAMFQPARMQLACSSTPNPIAPSVGPYREAIKRLMTLKREGAPIANSMAGLKHMACWPDHTSIRCHAGILTLDIEPDGRMVACDSCPDAAGQNPQAPAQQTTDLSLQYQNLRLPEGCGQCWCAPLVELNLAFAGSAKAGWNLFRLAAGQKRQT